jgi:hypothetical protein
MVKPKVDKGTVTSKGNCIEIGMQALNLFTQEELKDYISEVYAKARSYTNLKGQAAIDQAIKDIGNEKMQMLFDDCARKANNVAKYEQRVNEIENGRDLKQLLSPRGKSQANNIESSQSAARAVLADSFYDQNFTKENESFFYDKKNTDDISRALDGKTASPMAKEIAKKLENYRQTRNAELVRAGALPIEYLSTFKYLDHMHDQSAMINGGHNLVQRAKNKLNGIKEKIDAKKAWVNYIKGELDLNATFGKTRAVDKEGNISDAIVDEILSITYDNITTNKSELFTNSAVVNDIDAINKKKRMFLMFKDWSSFARYNDKYGHGDFASALMADIQGSGSKIGMADFFGESPINMYLDLKKKQTEVGIKTSMPESLWYHGADKVFKQVSGSNQLAVSPTLASIGANVRALTSTVRLVGLALRSIPDMAHSVAYLGRFGHNEFSAYGHMIANLFNNPMMRSEERQLIAKKFKLLVDSHLGYVARIVDAQNMGKFANRITSKVFKWNLVEAFDRGNKLSVMHMMARTIGEQSSKSWKSLPDSLRNQLYAHNFTEKEWDLLRSKTQKRLFTTDNVDLLTDEELRGLEGDTPLLNRKAELYRKVYSLFDVASQNTTLSPTAFEKAYVYNGTTAGTPMGEFFRTIGQFKMYPIAFIDRVWRQGLESQEGISAKMWYGTKLIAGCMTLSYISMIMENLSMYKTMPDPSKMSVNDRIKYYTSLAAPGVGIFMRLMDSKNQNKSLFFSTLRSPSTDLIQEMLSGALSLVTGDLKNSKKQFKNAAYDILPINTVPFLSPLLRESLGEKPYLQPGQQQLYGA